MNVSGQLPVAGSARHSARTFLAGCRRFARLLRSGVTRQRHPLRAAEAQAWAGRLAVEADSLLDLVHGMEEEFLATGDGLDRLVQQLEQIKQLCQSLSQLTLGQTEDAAVAFAFQLLKKAEDFVLASYDQYDHVFATFGELQDQLAQLARQHAELMRVLLPLNFITTTLRIEASRHPPEVQQAFFTLAAGINQTVNEVRNTMEQQFAEFAASESIAYHLITQISASVTGHRQEVTATLNSSRVQLRNLNVALLNSLGEATDLDRLNQSVNQHIGGLVIAQQCHDITRQKMEHIGEAMQEMRRHLMESPTSASAMDLTVRAYIYQAGQIQLQQVQSVFDQLDEAAGKLKSGIHSLQADAGAASLSAVKMGKTALDTKVARQCQEGIGEILGIVRQAVLKISDIIAAFQPLQASFVDCTDKASSLANDVRHAGLNAQVFAIHAPNGATLEVLAGRVRMISEDVIRQVDQLRGSLNHTAAMISNLRLRLEDFQILGQAEQEVLTVESTLSRNKLTHLEEAIPELLQQITKQQETFAKSINQVLANVKFPETVAEARPRAIGFFQDLVAWSGQGGASVDGKSAEGKIEQLRSNYTMASERQNHTAALQTKEMLPETTAAGPLVEMFADPEIILPAATVSPGSLAVPDDIHGNSPPEDRSLSATSPAVAGAKNPGLGENVELF